MSAALLTRPVEPEDEVRFLRLWPRLSRDTIYRRFHAPLHCLPTPVVQRLVRVDHDSREALVILEGDEVVGVARYERNPADPSTADVAIVVEDRWQGRGLGQRLLRELVQLAEARGVRTVTADIQTDNARMLHIARELFPELSSRLSPGVYSIVAPLAASAARPRVPEQAAPAVA
jgi:GNAT superfamily N-acetyltransferase